LSKDQFRLGKKWKHMKFLSLALALTLGLTLAGCGWNHFHKMYSATAVIQIEPRTSFMRELPDASTQIATEIEFMQSPDNLTPIIQKLKLDQIWAKRFKSDHDVLSPQKALDHLRKVLKIETVSGTNIIKVTACSEAPQEAADIANAVADNFKALRDQEEAERNKRGVDALRNMITQQQKVVDDAKADLAKMQQNDSAHREFNQQQSLLDALNNRLKEVIHDIPLQESRVRIVSRAVASPE
jgi:uncharacterized protein involved in exopolysaccharide biosynthesis